MKKVNMCLECFRNEPEASKGAPATTTVVTKVTYACDTFEVNDVNARLSFIIITFPIQQGNAVVTMFPHTVGQ
jgi:hypothetical protein